MPTMKVAKVVITDGGKGLACTFEGETRKVKVTPEELKLRPGPLIRCAVLEDGAVALVREGSEPVFIAPELIRYVTDAAYRRDVDADGAKELAATVGLRAREERLHRGFSLTTVAKWLGMKRSNYSRLEAGGGARGSAPSLATMKKLSFFLDVTLDDLVRKTSRADLEKAEHLLREARESRAQAAHRSPR